jgi:hypothetical protein
MNAQIHKPEWQRIEIWLLGAAIVAAVLLVLAPRASDFDRTLSSSTRETSLPAPASVPQIEGLPFTALDVVQYFSTVLERSAEKGAGGTMVFENISATYPEDRWHIAVSVERKSVVVEFVFSGDYGMSLAREFFESPLFQRQESEQLYEMLAHAQNSPAKRLARFTVSMTHRETSQEQNLVLRFTAPNAA